MLAAAVAYGAIRASKTLHEALLSNIMRCPMSFFDTTPLGRIINRFSKDVDTMDAELRMFIQVGQGQVKVNRVNRVKLKRNKIQGETMTKLKATSKSAKINSKSAESN